jgi:hypothetical protein
VEELAEAYRYPPLSLPDLHGGMAGAVRGEGDVAWVAKVTTDKLLGGV